MGDWKGGATTAGAGSVNMVRPWYNTKIENLLLILFSSLHA